VVIEVVLVDIIRVVDVVGGIGKGEIDTDTFSGQLGQRVNTVPKVKLVAPLLLWHLRPPK
jgi:hypothetical protein